MITEFVVAAGIVYSANWFKASKERELKRKFNDILMKCKVDGIRNKEEQTFLISKIYPKEYGYFCTLTIPRGLSIEALDKAKSVIENGLNCIIEIDKDRFKEYATMKIVNKILDNNYEPVFIKPHELFLGYKFDCSHYKLDLNKDPHVLLAGKTGSGKSFLFASILTNLIYYNKKHIEIYLLQVMKGEIDIFKNCPSVKFTSDKIEEILTILKKLSDMIHTRSKQFAAYGIKNITQWNHHFTSKKMKRIIIGTEEISFFISEDSPCFPYFINIVKAGRSVGIHLIALTQRTTVANLPSELKAQMTVVTARQRSELDSRNAIDIGDAARLEPQEFIASSNDGYVTFRAPTADEDFNVLNKYVPEIKIPTINKIEDDKLIQTKHEEYPYVKPIEAIEPPKVIKVPKHKAGVKSC